MYVVVLIIYILLLFLVGYLTSKKDNTNNTFFSANKKSKWYIVAFGMIGASISGISIVSVPGMVINSGWTYLQTCIGFFFGYLVVAFVLLPLYYKLNLTSIYEYLNKRFGNNTYMTGSLYFIIAKMVSSATKLYIAVLVLQQFIFDQWGIPFGITVIGCIFIIWMYTHRAGIRTIVWTDSLQTFFFITAIIIMSIESYELIGLDFKTTLCLLNNSNSTTTFIFNDWFSTQNFFKQFISGIFIVIVMTGLDQDMMQKNLTCKTLKESKKNMLSYGIAFIPINFILLLLGSMLFIYSQLNVIKLPDSPDKIMPMFASSIMSPSAGICFILGIISASFSSADSALTAITTTLSVDIFKCKNNDKMRKFIHICVCAIFAVMVIIFGYTQNNSIIDTIYTIVGYAYGPLLGLYSFGMITNKNVKDKYVPIIAIISPFICYFINYITILIWNYKFGYELLLLNGIITFIGLILIIKKK